MDTYCPPSPPLRALLAALVLGLAALPAGADGALSRVSWFAHGSILFFLEDNGMESDPMPVLPSLGVGISYPVADTLRLEFTMDFYTTHYGFSHSLNRPVPVAIENRTARVMGFLMALQLSRHFDITRNATIRAFGGPAADFRAVFAASGLGGGLDDMAQVRRDTDLVRSYFWSQGRWFMPVAGVGADYAVSPDIRLGLDFRVWMPAYRLWTRENLPAVEGWRFGPGIRITI